MSRRVVLPLSDGLFIRCGHDRLLYSLSISRRYPCNFHHMNPFVFSVCPTTSADVPRMTFVSPARLLGWGHQCKEIYSAFAVSLL